MTYTRMPTAAAAKNLSRRMFMSVWTPAVRIVFANGRSRDESGRSSATFVGMEGNATCTGWGERRSAKDSGETGE